MKRPKTSPLKPRRLERVVNRPIDIDPALWQRGYELWAELHEHRLDSERNIKSLLPLIQAWDEVERMKVRLAELEAEA